MKKLVLPILIALLILMFSAEACAEVSVGAYNGDTAYSSLQDAIDDYQNGIIILYQNAENITISRDTCIDLNGNHITSVTVTNGTLYCMDSETDDFTVADGVYGTVTDATGNIAALPAQQHSSAYNYLTISSDTGLSFHRVLLSLTAISLRTSQAGIYYKSQFCADEIVAQQVTAYGVALSLLEAPDRENIEDLCVCSSFNSFVSGGDANTASSTLLKGIIKNENTQQQNAKNAQRKVYAAAYIRTNHTVITGSSAAWSLQELTEAIDKNWDCLTNAQKTAFCDMYGAYIDVMESWYLPNAVNAIESGAEQIEATMTQQTYHGVNYWLYTPADSTDNMPLIVYLHGGSGKGEDLNLLTDVEGFPRYVKEGRISCRAYIIFPQCPSSQKGWKTMGGKVEALISYICSTYGLDTGKVSLTGHSMGGTGTWTLALDKPELFYKIAPMSGSVTMNDSNLETLSAIPVWAVVGDSDTIVSPDSSIAMIDTLQQNGATAIITVFEGATHFDIPGLGYLSTEVVNWLIT